MKYCQHNECRAAAIQNLKWLAPLLGVAETVRAVNIACTSDVRCQHVPRPGPVDAPLPGDEA